MDTPGEIRELQQRALAAFDAGSLREALQLYSHLLERRPGSAGCHHQLARTHKYLREWAPSLAHALRALAAGASAGGSAAWDAGIAATALGDWPQARRQWRACGIDIGQGEGAVEHDFGICCIRLNPWSGSETVFARRIDPARARIANVPLPASGHRHGDLVLNDGIQVGERDYHGRGVPVFNELQRMQPSPNTTFTAFVACESDDEVEALLGMATPGVAAVEDWTRGLRQQCLRCNYGIAHKHHRHAAAGTTDWNPDRTLGVAAESAGAARSRIEAWVAAAPARRRLDAIIHRESPTPTPASTGAGAWWRAPR